MSEQEPRLPNHTPLTRRFFLRAGAALAAGGGVDGAWAADAGLPAALAAVVARLPPYFTPPADFRDVSRGNPLPHTLPPEKMRQAGMTRDTWRLEVLSDPEHPSALRRELTRKDGTALDFPGLLQLADKHAVRFPKIMTCLNLSCPLGTGVWEGVPLREVLWLTRPREDLRRVFYHGYHNDDPKQVFRSSLPVGRVLEDYHGLPPVILCYKLNGEWLSPERGGPVRVVVPEGYGFKSVKWLNTLVLSNLYNANDTYANGNNDVDSPLKTFAATLAAPKRPRAGQPIPVTGYAQVGIAGLAKVQVWVQKRGESWPDDDPYFTKAPWSDATILPAPEDWGKALSGPAARPPSWPVPLAKAYWAALLPALPVGDYVLRCRTIDAAGAAQPMPRPFRKSGRCDIEEVKFSAQA